MKTFHILQLAGYGDTLSAITRLPAVKEKYPDYKIKFWLGGFGKAPLFSKQQLEREGYEASLIKNLTFHNQLPQMRDFIVTKFVKEGDRFEDWSFCDEIFNNKKPVFSQYEMQYPYEYKTSEPSGELKIFAQNIKDKKGVAIHPLTKDGNAEGFESDVENGRFWKKEFWCEVCHHLENKGLTPTFVGINDEDWELKSYCDLNDVPYIDAMGFNIEETMYLLSNTVGCIACNSWDWEVTSRLCIPTVVFYTKNHFFIQNHTPPTKSTFWDSCYIETNCVQTAKATIPPGNSSMSGRLMKGQEEPSEIFDKFCYLYENNKKPLSYYSVCMISYNDEECIRDTMENVSPYITDDFVITDGGSTDKTLDIINEYDTKLISKKWEDNFEIQKNSSLEQANQEWRVWIDADETYEPLFWNQLSWYIRDGDLRGVDCINVPRINTVDGLTKEFAETHKLGI